MACSSTSNFQREIAIHGNIFWQHRADPLVCRWRKYLTLTSGRVYSLVQQLIPLVASKLDPHCTLLDHPVSRARMVSDQLLSYGLNWPQICSEIWRQPVNDMDERLIGAIFMTLYRAKECTAHESIDLIPRYKARLPIKPAITFFQVRILLGTL